MKSFGNLNQRIYLDHNASTPLFPALEEEFGRWLKLYGNPSSVHWEGRESKRLIRESRKKLAEWLKVHSDEVIFTSGGSEANNLALQGGLRSLASSLHLGEVLTSDVNKSSFVFSHPSFSLKSLKTLGLLVSVVEHPSVLETARQLESQGIRLDFVPVKKRSGEIDLEVYEEKLKGQEIHLVSVMYANNETGHIYPIKKMAALAHKWGALFHSDMIQALGKLPFSLEDLDVDFATFSGHKFCALKGSGFLYVKKAVGVHPQMYGGKQEKGYRAGTENLLSIASMGSMAEFKEEMEGREKEIQKMRDEMEREIKKNLSGVYVVGQECQRLPNTSHIIFQAVDGESLLMNLDLRGFALSSRSACHSGASEPSSVLLAMGFSEEEAKSSLRISLGWDTKKEDLERFVQVLMEEVRYLRSISGEKASMRKEENVF